LLAATTWKLKNKNFTLNDLFSRIDKDSLEFNASENTYYDRFGDEIREFVQI
jgi:hypothetical protein